MVDVRDLKSLEQLNARVGSSPTPGTIQKIARLRQQRSEIVAVDYGLQFPSVPVLLKIPKVAEFLAYEIQDYYFNYRFTDSNSWD